MNKTELRYLVKAAAYNVHRKNLLKQNIKAACIARDLRKEDLKGAILAYMSGDKSAAGVGKFIGGWVGRAGTALANRGFARSGAAFGNAANLLNTGLRNTGRTLMSNGWNAVKQRMGNAWTAVKRRAATARDVATHPVTTTQNWINNLTGRNQRAFMEGMEGRTFKDLAAAGKQNLANFKDPTSAMKYEKNIMNRAWDRAGKAGPSGYNVPEYAQKAFENEARRIQMATNKARVQAGVVGMGLLATGAGIYQAGSGYNPTTNSLQHGYMT